MNSEFEVPTEMRTPHLTHTTANGVSGPPEVPANNRSLQINVEGATSDSTNAQSNDRPTLLYVTAAVENNSSGNAIYDKKLIAALGTYFNIRTVSLSPQIRVRLVIAMFAHLLPPVYARYLTSRNRQLLRAALQSEQPVATILSSESLAPLSTYCHPDTTSLIFHNVHSRISTVNVSERLLLPWYRRTESSLLQSRHTKFFLAELDARYARNCANGISIAANTVPPGVPQRVFSRPENPVIKRQLVLTGSLGWYRKRRDLNWFIRQLRTQLIVDVVTDLDYKLPAHWLRVDYKNCKWNDYYRVGVIPERFSAGFKLKTLDLISKNCIVVSFTDLSEDFKGIDNFQEFIVHLDRPRGLIEFLRGLKDEPDSRFADRFQKFKLDCQTHFSWEGSASTIAGYLCPRTRTSALESTS